MDHRKLYCIAHATGFCLAPPRTVITDLYPNGYVGWVLPAVPQYPRGCPPIAADFEDGHVAEILLELVEFARVLENVPEIELLVKLQRPGEISASLSAP